MPLTLNSESVVVNAIAMEVCLAVTASDIMDQGLPHGPWRLHETQFSTCSLVPALINDINMIFTVNTDNEYQHGLECLIPAWPLMAVWVTEPAAATGGTGTRMAQRSSEDRADLSSGLHQENEWFFILDILLFYSQSDHSICLGSTFRGTTCKNSGLLYITLLAPLWILFYWHSVEK